MQQVIQDPVIILFFILFITIIIGFVIVFIVTYQKKQLLARITIDNMQQYFSSQLIQTQLEVQEQTVKHLATELHDNIGQLLSLTNVTLASVDIYQTEKANQKITNAQQLVQRTVQELRQLSKVLHGEQLLQSGLAEAIQQEINWLQRNGYYTIHFNNMCIDFQFTDSNKNLFLYRLLQESLNNIIKHAEAKIIEIELKYEAPKLMLQIKDDGKGFNEKEQLNNASKGMGLSNMKKRIELIGGEMHINSFIGSGTTISFAVPYTP